MFDSHHGYQTFLRIRKKRISTAGAVSAVKLKFDSKTCTSSKLNSLKISIKMLMTRAHDT